ncbi:MAG: AraC family transcriptional regulator [Bacteroidia bacterium]
MKQKLPVLSVGNFRKTPVHDPGFYIETFQEHRKEHPFIMDAHRHDFYMLMLFTKGKGIHTIDLNTYKVEPGSVFFMSPGEMHAWNLSDNTDGYVLMFNSAFFVMNAQNRSISEFSFFSQRNKISYGKLKSPETGMLGELMRIMLNESQENGPHGTKILRAYLDILLFKLADIFGSRNAPATAPRLISRLEELIELHYRDHQPVGFYAGQLAISPVQLNKISQDYLGRSAKELGQDRLLAEAKRLLVYTELTISEISGQLNFSDNSYFTKFFKKLTDTTPEKFRDRLLP